MPAPRPSRSRWRGSTRPPGYPPGSGRLKDRPGRGSARDDRRGHGPLRLALTDAASGLDADAFRSEHGYGRGVRADAPYPRSSTDASRRRATSCLRVTFRNTGPGEARHGLRTHRRRRNWVVGIAARLDCALTNKPPPTLARTNPHDDVHSGGPLLHIPEHMGLDAKSPADRSDHRLRSFAVGI